MTPSQVTEIDGVPVLLAPGSGPMRAGLVFRVGSADETLATTGITHLVEHLALHRHGTADYHYNGTTGRTTTEFVIQGTPEAVVRFLDDVCACLGALPIDRLATEKKIIETEAANGSTPVNRQLPLWRHGARDFGLLSYPEWGVHQVTGEQVEAWATSRFNRANAVLWIAGDHVPSGLRLDLPDGRRWALPAESSALPVTPAYFTSGAPAIVLEAQVPRTRAAAAYANALERALFRELRQHRGLSYTAATAYGTDGRPHATVTAIADTRPDAVDAALDCFLAQLRALRENDIEPVELDTIRSLQLEALASPDADAGLLHRRATDLLTGYPSPTTPELVSGFQELTAADIRGIAATVDRSALLMVPQVSTRPPAGFEAAPTFSRFSVAGKRHRSRLHRDVAIVHGADGVSLTTAHGPSTVLFDDCAALLRYPDGGRHLFGPDGINVRIEPTLFPVPVSALSRLDAAVPPAAVVVMPPREGDAIPQPARLAVLRALLRMPSVTWRGRLDRFAFLGGGAGSLLLTIALVATGATMLALALALARPGFGGIAFFCGTVLVWRWHRNDHW